MALDLFALEAEAHRITGGERSDVYELAASLIGPITRAEPGAMTANAQARLVASGILVRHRLPEHVERFAVAHELAHHLLGHEHHRDEHAEAEADYLAACLVVPTRALREARHALGDDIEALAEYFGTTQTCVLVRMGEAREVAAVAVVTPRIVRVRSHQLVLPSPDELRRLSRSSVLRPGIRKVQITDDRRTALVVDEIPESSRSAG